MRLTNRIKEAGATGVHFTLASRNSDSDFAPDLSTARLHRKIEANRFIKTRRAGETSKVACDLEKLTEDVASLGAPSTLSSIRL